MPLEVLCKRSDIATTVCEGVRRIFLPRPDVESRQGAGICLGIKDFSCDGGSGDGVVVMG
jgi:hypothetical protein